jgi:hypothetical protein
MVVRHRNLDARQGFAAHPICRTSSHGIKFKILLGKKCLGSRRLLPVRGSYATIAFNAVAAEA